MGLKDRIALDLLSEGSRSSFKDDCELIFENLPELVLEDRVQRIENLYG